MSFLLMANGPSQGDIVELMGAFNVRSTTDFRKTSQNVVGHLESQTKAVIEKTTKTQSGYGICVKPLSRDPQDSCQWIYYNPKKPYMVLYKTGDAKDTKVALNNWKLNNDENALTVIQSVRGAEFVKTLRDLPTVPDHPLLRPAILTQPVPQIDTPKPPAADVKGVVISAVVRDQALRGEAPTSGNFSAVAPNISCQNCMTCYKEGEKCNARNRYLEKSIEPYFQQFPPNSPMATIIGSSSDGPIDRQCIESSLTKFPSDLRFVECSQKISTDAKNPEKKSIETFYQSSGKACLSINYKSFIAKNVNMVASCLKDYESPTDEERRHNMANIYKLINHESGFHVNAASSSAYGIGQLLPGAVRHVNGSAVNSLRDQLAKASQSKPECKALIDLLKVPINPNSCDRTSIEKGNPAINLMYTFAYQGILRDSISNFFQSPANNQFFESIPKELRNQFVSDLAAWSHNTGGGGMQSNLRITIKKWKAKMTNNPNPIKSKADLDEFYKDLSADMLRPVGRSSISTSNRGQASRFFKMLDQNFKDWVSPNKTVQSCINL